MRLNFIRHSKITRDIWTLYFLDDDEQYRNKLIVTPEELIFACCNSISRDYQYKLPADLVKDVYYTKFYNSTEEAKYISHQVVYEEWNTPLTLASYTYNAVENNGIWNAVLANIDRSKPSAICYFAFQLPKQVDTVEHTSLPLAGQVELLCENYLKLTRHVQPIRDKRPIII